MLPSEGCYRSERAESSDMTSRPPSLCADSKKDESVRGSQPGSSSSSAPDSALTDRDPINKFLEDYAILDAAGKASQLGRAGLTPLSHLLDGEMKFPNPPVQSPDPGWI